MIKDLKESESPIVYIKSINVVMESCLKAGEMWNREEHMSEFVSMKENTHHVHWEIHANRIFLKNLTGKLGYLLMVEVAVLR